MRYTLMLLFMLCGFAGAAFAVDGTYTLNPGDQIVIASFDDERLDRELTILPDGKIYYPVIGEIQAVGKTPPELEAFITKSLIEKKILQPGAVINVTVSHATGNTVYVLGQVSAPGAYTTFAKVDVMQALSLAGGLTPFAKRGSIRILRNSAQGQEVFKFDYGDVERGKHLETNIVLQPGDTVMVP